MIIAVEGPDGAGKSTLCSAIGAEGLMNGLEVRKFYFTGPGTLAEYMFIIAEDKLNQLLVVDRWHYGELVYGTTARQMPNFGFTAIDIVDKYVRDLGGRIVVLAPPLPVLFDRLDEKGEETPPALSAERDRFEFIAKVQQRNFPRTVQLYETWDPEMLAQKLVREVLA